jgi:hypothetical protein
MSWEFVEVSCSKPFDFVFHVGVIRLVEVILMLPGLCLPNHSKEMWGWYSEKGSIFALLIGLMTMSVLKYKISFRPTSQKNPIFMLIWDI